MWSERRESNPHALSGTGLSTLRACHVSPLSGSVGACSRPYTSPGCPRVGTDFNSFTPAALWDLYLTPAQTRAGAFPGQRLMASRARSRSAGHWENPSLLCPVKLTLWESLASWRAG